MMALEESAPVIAPVAAAETAPVVAVEPVAAPVVTAPAEPVAPAAPVVDPVAAPEAKPETPARAETLLGKFDKEAAKPSDAAAETKPVEPAVVAEAPTAYEFKLPDGFQAEPDRMKAFGDVLNGFKDPTASPQDLGQKLIDMHTAALTQHAEQVTQNQFKVFNDMLRGWETEIMSDPEIGGSGFETTLKAVARMRDLFVSPQDSGPEGAFSRFLDTTGAGSNPAFFRFMHNLARRFDEPAPSPTNIRPPPDIGRKPQARGAGMLYDNPRSQPAGR